MNTTRERLQALEARYRTEADDCARRAESETNRRERNDLRYWERFWREEADRVQRQLEES